MLVNVQGKWAFISGASRGIGRLIAEFMADQGCNLILHKRCLEYNDYEACVKKCCKRFSEK